MIQNVVMWCQATFLAKYSPRWSKWNSRLNFSAEFVKDSPLMLDETGLTGDFWSHSRSSSRRPSWFFCGGGTDSRLCFWWSVLLKRAPVFVRSLLSALVGGSNFDLSAVCHVALSGRFRVSSFSMPRSKTFLRMITSIYRQISMQLILGEVVSLGNPRRFWLVLLESVTTKSLSSCLPRTTLDLLEKRTRREDLWLVPVFYGVICTGQMHSSSSIAPPSPYFHLSTFTACRF